MKTIKTKYSSFVESYIRPIGSNIEFDGFVRNIHESFTLCVKCCIRDDYGGYVKILELLPQKEKLVMQHRFAGLKDWNDFSFEVVEVMKQQSSK